MLKIGLAGTGYLGKIHLKCIKALEDKYDFVGFYEIDEQRRKEVAEETGITPFDSFEALLKEVDLVDIVTTTETHYALAKKALESGKHVFIEKPITANLEDAQTLFAMVKESGLKLQVGHVERFNPAFLVLRDKKLNPMFIESHRLAGFNPRGNDVSVVKDLMIHDIDVILSVVPSTVKQVSASGVSVLTDNIDICNAQVEFENGCIANITASRVSLKQMRKLRLFQPDSYLSVDFLKKETQWIHKVDSDFEPEGIEDAFFLDLEGDDKKLLIQQEKVEEVNAIRMELSEFADSITKDTKEVVSVDDAVRSLELAQTIEDAVKARLNKYEKSKI